MTSLKELSAQIDQQQSPIRQAAQLAMQLPEYIAYKRAQASFEMAQRNARGEPGDLGGPAPYNARAVVPYEQKLNEARGAYEKRLLSDGVSQTNLSSVMREVDRIEQSQEASRGLGG